jgi:hypothetical protein
MRYKELNNNGIKRYMQSINSNKSSRQTDVCVCVRIECENLKFRFKLFFIGEQFLWDFSFE